MKRTLITLFGILIAMTGFSQSGNFTTLRVFPLTGYMYANGTNLVTASPTIPVDDIDGLAAKLVYTGKSPTTTKVGGLDAGSDILDSSFTYIFEKILTPYNYPAFTSFSMSGQSNAVEVGQTVSGSKSFTWAFSFSENISANTFDVYDVTAANYIATNISTSSPQSIDIGSVTKTTATSNQWRGEADNTLSETFTSGNYTINWRWRRFHGYSSVQTVNNAQVLALSGSELSTSKSYSVSTGSPSGDQYYVYAYPTSFGALSSISVNGFPSIDAFTRFTLSVINSYGVTTDYYVYYSNNTFNSSAEISYQ